jgi:imidazolonepropionase-like amidohydrolase
MTRFVFATLIAASSLSILSAGQNPATGGVTVFTGARVITGDGAAPIQNGAFIVNGGRFSWVGVLGDAKIPAGAARVDLSGKTVIPALIDTHTHLSATREELVNDLQRRALYGVGAAASLGQDSDVAFKVRDEVIPNAARFRTAGRGITAPEPGRSTAPYWVSSEAEARKAVQELAARKVDIVKIWVDDRDGKYTKLSPALYGAVIDEAHRRGLRVTAHVFTVDDAKGLLRAGIDAFAHVAGRDRDIDDEAIALFRKRPDVIVEPNLPIAASRRISAGCAPACPRESSTNCRRPRRRIGRRRSARSGFRRAMSRAWQRKASASRWAPTATRRGVRISRWPTWWRPA